jgi:hypothetical protein
MSDDIVGQLLAAKAPPAVIDAARKRIEVAPVDQDFHVWPENWNAVQLFLKLSTQWDVRVGMAGAAYIGIRYESVPGQMARLRILPEEQPDYWDYLELMERAALPLLNKPKK